jgi:hypothetical protein
VKRENMTVYIVTSNNNNDDENLLSAHIRQNVGAQGAFTIKIHIQFKQQHSKITHLYILCLKMLHKKY